MDSSVPGGGAIMPQPDGISPKAIKEIQSALTTGKGAITLVETTGQGFGAGITARPSEDWTQKRFGPVIPEHNIALRDSSAMAIMEAFGVSQSIYRGDGNAQLTARRAMYLDVIEPTSRIIAGELSLKLEQAIKITHEESDYFDAQRIARAALNLTQAGMSIQDAGTLLGLDKL